MKTSAQVNLQDSLSLVDLYNSTNGANWVNHTNWLTAEPVSSWYGVFVSGNNVTQINLANNNLADTIPLSLGNFSELVYLNLSYNQLSGTIPSSLGNLLNLQYLYLPGNKLGGFIPSTLGNLISLRIFHLFSNQLIGEIPSTLGNLSNLTQLDLYSNQLSGSIPSSLGNLFNLQNLDLFSNQLSDSIPSSFGNLNSIQLLSLDYNFLSGSIPASLGNLHNLVNLGLSHNQLSGTIPPSFGNLASIKEIILNHNYLSDSIPSSVGNLYNLTYVDFSYNQLIGAIPSSLGNLTQLYFLSLNNNLLSGTIPASLNNLVHLFNLSIDNNHFVFDGMEQLAKSFDSIQTFAYSPQAAIKLHYKENTFAVSAGGSLINNTYYWYNNEKLIKTVTGDSTFKIKKNGNYHVAVKNMVATQLTLYSDTIDITTLPISLISFIAQKQNNFTLLQWQTINEINNNYFSIERSSDSKTFSSIGTEQGLNNASVNNYSFTDNAPLKGINYYRLKQVDKNGRFTYSGIASVEFLKNEIFAVAPNPANNNMNIIIPESNSVSEIMLYDVNGKKILSKQIAANITSKQINISAFAKGIYNIMLMQNGKRKILKLVKN